MQQLQLVVGWLATRFAWVSQDERGGLSAVEEVILVAVIGGAVLAGALVFSGALTAAWGRLVNLVNGIG